MTLRLAWLTDIHMNFLSPEQMTTFCAELQASEAEAFLITGDISEAPTLAYHLALLGDSVQRPVYFVLGNHDFYKGSIEGVRRSVAARCAGSPWLRYLPEAGVVALSDACALVGHDGWADGRFGNYRESQVMLNDYVLIRDLARLSPEERLRRMQSLAEEGARHLRRALTDALDRYPRVLVATHVPPFREACWYQDAISDDNYLPHFASKVSGDALTEVLGGRPGKEVLVLCGHTHGGGRTQPLTNLEVRTGGAEYGRPAIQEILGID